MNFVNRLVSKILTVLAMCLTVYTVVFTSKDSSDVAVFAVLIVSMVLLAANMGYDIVLFKKYAKSYDTKFVGNECAMNMTISIVAFAFIVVEFIIAMVGWLYLIWY